MNKYLIKKTTIVFSLSIFLMVSTSIISNNLSYAYVEFDVSGSGSRTEDQSLTDSQSSNQGSYCYAPPNAAIINSCNSGELSSSENTGLNLYGQ
ncbi:MAG TPA: hypothetical protein VJU13_05100 [Candidatus Nitrosocosmicus sp.]|nr:hypothetical protein [Candidatus Nitrosocosmicus sp.]